ncbi:hypothetical protein SprV_0501894900 [Sparganum proliferum]
MEISPWVPADEVKSGATRTLKTSLKRLQIDPANCTQTTPPIFRPPTLPRSSRRQLTLTELLNPHCHPRSPQHPLRRLLNPPPLHSILTHRQTSTSPTPTPAMWTRSTPVFIVSHLHLTYRSVICEFIAKTLTSQCLENPHKLAAFASTVHNAPAHSLTAWAFSSTCASTRAEVTVVPKRLAHPAHAHNIPSPTHTPQPIAPTISSSTAATITETDPDISYLSCPHCSRTSTSHIGLVGHLRIHRTETSEPVPGAPTYTRYVRLNCSHGTRTFTHRMGLLGHMRVHEGGINRSLDAPSISCTSTMPNPNHAPPSGALATSSSATATISETDNGTVDFPCLHCPRTFTSHIALVSHLHTETGEPVSGAPTYTRLISSTCPHSTRTSTHTWIY